MQKKKIYIYIYIYGYNKNLLSIQIKVSSRITIEEKLKLTWLICYEGGSRISILIIKSLKSSIVFNSLYYNECLDQILLFFFTKSNETARIVYET
jgi:CMP-2-keto-3-deoxyoctulosonic acid synthetase